MTILNELWKKFKTNEPLYPNERKGEDQLLKSKSASKPPTQTTTQPITTITQPNPQPTIGEVLTNFEQNEVESLQMDTVLENLKELKKIVDAPKEEKPELRFTKIKQHLGDPECHETVRQERWPENIRCPQCKSTHLKRLPQVSSKSANNHRYECLDCGTTFNDDTDTPMEKGVPPLNIWMQCWYLMGCTDSITYISAKLNLDISIVENMVRALQKLFQAQKPLTRFMSYEEWSKQSNHLREQLKEDLLKQYERLNANISTAPKDTAEFRRQQNIRRGLNVIEPPSPTPGKKR